MVERHTRQLEELCLSGRAGSNPALGTMGGWRSWLARFIYTEEVGGSNPPPPTKLKKINMAKQKIIKQVADNFIAQLKITQRKTKKPVVVAMVGIIGSGKSLVAKQLAKLIKATAIEDDAVRVALRKKRQGYGQVRSITERATTYVLKKRGNVVLDSDYVTSQNRKSLEKKVKKIQGLVLYIRTIADRDVMIERLIKAKYNPNHDLFKNSIIAVREMWRRTPHHYRWESKAGGRFILRKLRVPFLTEIETDGDWKKKVQKIAQRIKKM